MTLLLTDSARFDTSVAAAGVVLLLLSLLGCGGEGGQGNAEDRFSIENRGLDAAVDSVRSARRGAAGGRNGSGGRGARSSLPEGVPAALDSGNAAYRSGNYRAALEQFESITEEHPGVQAGWFGVYMAHRALGNAAAADSAMRRAGMGSSEAARVHGSTGDSSSPHDFSSDTTGGR